MIYTVTIEIGKTSMLGFVHANKEYATSYTQTLLSEFIEHGCKFAPAINGYVITKNGKPIASIEQVKTRDFDIINMHLNNVNAPLLNNLGSLIHLALGGV